MCIWYCWKYPCDHFINKHKILLRKIFYFLVLHLAICDAFTLLSIFFLHLKIVTFLSNCINILGICLLIFQTSGVTMMLIISVLRFRAVVHPLNPSFSRRKIKIICGLACIIGLVTAVLLTNLECMKFPPRRYYIYEWLPFFACFYIFPIIFMTVTYSIIARALIKQRKALRAFSNATPSHFQCSSNSSSQRYTRGLKTFFVCAITVLCFSVGHIYYMTAWFHFFYSAETNTVN